MKRPFQEMENRSLLFILLLIHTTSPLFQELCTRLFVFQTNFLLECVQLLCMIVGFLAERVMGALGNRVTLKAETSDT